jgi:DNA polymerase III delta prime subunit
LFETGYKFVVLDEVDYMTKNAQQALKYLLQTCGNNVKFFLICNYISKIELSLQHEFVCIRFNQLPKQKIREFIREICVKEGVDLTDQNIDTIQNLHKSDIRSMINFIQLNQNVIVQQSNIVDDTIWKRLYDLFDGEKDATKIKVFINKLSIHYNIDKKQIIKDYYNYLILNHQDIVNPEIIEKMEIVIHNYDCNIEVLINYFIQMELAL